MNSSRFVGKNHGCGIAAVLAAFTLIFALPADAAVGPLEIRYHSQPNYQGPGTTVALTGDPQHIHKLVPAITGANSIKSIEVGSDVAVALFEEPNYAGDYHFATASSTSLSVWNKTTSSLIVYRKSAGSPAGIEVWAANGLPRQFFPCLEFAWSGSRAELYYLNNTPMAGSVAFARRWGQNTRGELRYGTRTLQIPSATRGLNETYSLGDYNASGKVGSVDVVYMSDSSVVQWLKHRRSLGAVDAVVMFEHKDGQGRSFTSYMKPDANSAHHADYRMGGNSSNDTISSLMLGDDFAVMLFEHDSGFGHHFIATESMNLPPDWDNRTSSFLLFPKSLNRPHGLNIVTNYSGGVFQPGRADIIFLPIHRLKSFSKISWEHLGSSLNDRIISIERSSDLIAFKACEHPKFKGKCVVRPGPGSTGLVFYPQDVGLFKKISTLEWWLIGPEKDKVRNCIDHGNNITSCTYALSSDPGHHAGAVETGNVSAERVDYQDPVVIGPIAPLPDRIEAPDFRRIKCDPGYYWSHSKGECMPRYIDIPRTR